VADAAGEEYVQSDLEPDLITITGWGMELRISEGKGGVLRQIGLEEADAKWAGKEITDEPLHAVLSVVGASAQLARWRTEDAFNEPFEDLKPPPVDPPSTEDLLGDGTVWLPQLGIGFTLYDGFVGEVIWRRLEDVPKEFCGPVTPEQIQLCISGEWRNTNEGKNARPPGGGWNLVQIFLTFALVVTLARIGWLGLRETQIWSQAIILNGRLVAIEHKPDKPGESRYRIEFKDPDGHVDMTILERSDFYIEPTNIGDQVSVCYVPENPPRVKGPAKARDAAFLRYMPAVAGVSALYGFAMLVASRLPRKKEGARIDDPLVKQI